MGRLVSYKYMYTASDHENSHPVPTYPRCSFIIGAPFKSLIILEKCQNFTKIFGRDFLPRYRIKYTLARTQFVYLLLHWIKSTDQRKRISFSLPKRITESEKETIILLNKQLTSIPPIQLNSAFPWSLSPRSLNVIIVLHLVSFVIASVANLLALTKTVNQKLYGVYVYARLPSLYRPITRPDIKRVSWRFILSTTDITVEVDKRRDAFPYQFTRRKYFYEIESK